MSIKFFFHFAIHFPASMCVFLFELILYACFFYFQNNITPLHVASRWGKSNMVTLLLDHEAVIEERTRVCLL